MRYTIDGQTLLDMHMAGMSLHFDNGAWNWLLNQPHPDYNANDFLTLEGGIEFAVIEPRLIMMTKAQRAALIFIVRGIT